MQRRCFLILGLTICVVFATSGAIVCYKCNSIRLDACAMALDASDYPYEECTTSLSCIMSIVDGITYRGCASDAPIVGATYKKSCETSLCNKGVYPPGRLKCYHCSGPECAEAPQGKPKPCLSHHEEDYCYTQVINAEHVNRGCRSDSNRTMSNDLVEYCAINGCNNRAAIVKLQCAECDSKTEVGCKRNLQWSAAQNCNITQHSVCEIDLTLSKEQRCFLYQNNERVVRGCSNAIPEDIKHDDENFWECDGDLCNTACLKQQKCISCDSSKNERCRDNALEIPKTTCGSAEISSCYACESKNWQVLRDCGPMPTYDRDMLRCYECSKDDGCNVKPWTRCYACSSLENPSCANWDRPSFANFIHVEECQSPGASCLVAALADGTIVRGCNSGHLSCNDSFKSCHQCNGSFCNKGPYPIDNLRCFQCDGNEECQAIGEDPIPCVNAHFDYPDACFEFYDAAGAGMKRGCRSNSSLYYECIFYNGGRNCHVCYENGCNKTPASKLQLN